MPLWVLLTKQQQLLTKELLRNEQTSLQQHKINKGRNISWEQKIHTNDATSLTQMLLWLSVMQKQAADRQGTGGYCVRYARA